MELSNITAWLASARPYTAGVALYAALGTSPTYLRLFRLGETDYSRAVLLRELRALVGPVQAAAATMVGTYAPEPPPAAPVAVAPPTGPESPLLAPVRQQLKAVRDERSHLHPHLTAPRAGSKARLAAALRILALTDEETRLKDVEAHVRAHGRLPGPVATAELTDAGELRQRLANLRSRRSKLKQHPARAADLAAAEAEILLIRSKLTP